MDPWDIITICCPEVLICHPSVVCSTHVVPRSHYSSVKSFDRWSRPEGERKKSGFLPDPQQHAELVWERDREVTRTEAQICFQFFKQPLAQSWTVSSLSPRASYSHSKMFPSEFLGKFILIWVSATEHLGIGIRASLPATTNPRQRLPDSWIDDGVAYWLSWSLTLPVH